MFVFLFLAQRSELAFMLAPLGGANQLTHRFANKSRR